MYIVIVKFMNSLDLDIIQFILSNIVLLCYYFATNHSIIYFPMHEVTFYFILLLFYFMLFFFILFYFVRCDGQQSCEMNVDSSNFGDPCEPTPKYLEVYYGCFQGIFFIFLFFYRVTQLFLCYSLYYYASFYIYFS